MICPSVLIVWFFCPVLLGRKNPGRFSALSCSAAGGATGMAEGIEKTYKKELDISGIIVYCEGVVSGAATMVCLTPFTEICT